MKSALKLYNTMSRSKEAFESREDHLVKMFTCGPSVYRRPHVGNYRTFAWEDLLQRYLEYLGYRVERVISLTDIEDKALAEAERHEVDVGQLTGEVVDRFLDECRLLRIDLPETIPRSSTSVDQAVELIKVLLEKGCAYRHKGDIFFDPLRYEGFGRLFGLDMSRWPAGRRRFRRDTYPGRRWNLGDFILWHGAREGDDPTWSTGIGRGRPAWNIQDPAMITKHLGVSIDICCGGIDNLYRHHDYNLAVVEAASGVDFARFWIHGEHLLCRGKKMSKSLGNIVYVEDLIRDGRTADHLRFFLLYGHHRKRMNLTISGFEKAAARLDDLRSRVRRILSDEVAVGRGAKAGDDPAGPLVDDFNRHMNDDLDAKSAIDSLMLNMEGIERLREAGSLGESGKQRVKDALMRIDGALRFLF
ncbi:MAG: class I tRNA ligase family protein [Syntrophobacteraceae bacterium]|jgi:cysteinyl-tRNA synthetase|nr:class I tRNA ligase family protein [Syntrophobacteraceae bacterium]